MKLIKRINIKDIKGINDALDSANGRGRKRTMNHATIVDMIDCMETRLMSLSVPKKAWQGCMMSRSFHVSCNSYKYPYETTAATIERGYDSWFLVSCGRDTITTDPNEFIKESYGILSDRQYLSQKAIDAAHAALERELKKGKRF